METFGVTNILLRHVVKVTDFLPGRIQGYASLPNLIFHYGVRFYLHTFRVRNFFIAFGF